MMAPPTADLRPLDDYWRRVFVRHGQHCCAQGCRAPALYVRTWRTAVMPAAAFACLCAEHAVEEEGR